MDSLVGLIEKFESEVRNNKGHDHLYDRFDQIMSRSHEYERYEEWFKILNPIHVGNILADIPEDPRWDSLADLIDETLSLQIEMLEDWKRNSYESFMANGGEGLLTRCMEY